MDVVDARVWIKSIPEFEEDMRSCSNAAIHMYGSDIEAYTAVRDNIQMMDDYMTNRIEDYHAKSK